MLSRDQLQRFAADTGFPADSLEKVWMLIQLLQLMSAHPFLGPRVALKGGTALNLFIFDLPRLSVDIDVNYIGAANRATMTAERPKIETALEQIVGRLGLTVKRAPTDHAGGKWRLSYTSALGRPAILEVDINFMLRTPLWPPVKRDSHAFLDDRANGITLLDDHELAAGKLAALLARGASRDLFDTREILTHMPLDPTQLRLAFVVYGGINRVDWRTVSIGDVATSATDVERQLLPMLRADGRPAHVPRWTTDLIDETHSLLAKVLPLTADEVSFLDQLNDDGRIEPELITDDVDLQDRLRAHPGLLWKALNVRKHRGG